MLLAEFQLLCQHWAVQQWSWLADFDVDALIYQVSLLTCQQSPTASLACRNNIDFSDKLLKVAAQAFVVYNSLHKLLAVSFTASQDAEV